MNHLPLPHRIGRATSRLIVTFHREPNPSLYLLDSQALGKYPADQLAKAYERAEASLEGWPSPASVVKLILERQCTQEYGWLMDGLASLSFKPHGVLLQPLALPRGIGTSDQD